MANEVTVFERSKRIFKDDIELEGSLLGPSTSYSSASSKQVVGPDLTLAAGAGRNIGDGTSFLAPIMGNVLGANLTKTGTYIAGLIGAFSVTGAKGSHLQVAGVLGIIMDTVTDADGAVVALIDGDSGVTKAEAAFAYRMNNSTAGSGVNFGLDLFHAAHDGFNEAAILKADLRLSKEVCVLQGAGVPTDGVAGTGAGVTEIGSIYLDRTNGEAYINAGTKASPTWKKITRAA